MIESNSIMDEVFFALCKSIDTPVSLGAWLRFKHSHAELAAMDINPSHYRDAKSFHLDYSVVSFLSKWKGLNTGIDLEDVATRKFTQSETACAETNDRLRRLSNGDFHPRYHQVSHLMMRKIARLLGPFSTFCISDLYGWGPGATFELPRRRAFLDTKMCETPISVSKAARSTLCNAIEGDLHWSLTLAHVEGALTYPVDTCRIETVPKNAKTHRIIAIEPRGNLFLQKGIGGYIRDRLRRVGINLDDQGRNQSLACRAMDLGLCTLDLKSASDSVSKELVWALLPYDWADAMDNFRSRQALMPDKSTVITLEKFSSMGNGFTFELETLIFWALVSSVMELSGVRGEVAVYGDDIICPREVATDVCLTLQFFGFSTNDDKSFFEGPFFESCGRHYFLGTDVTPAYQKEELTHPLSMVRLGNRLIRLAYRVGGYKSLHSSFKSCWEACRRLGQSSTGWAIPFGAEGDDGWLLPLSDWPAGRRFMTPSGWRDALNHGLVCHVAKTTSVKFPANDTALLAWSLRRGVVTEVPFMGELGRDDRIVRVRSSKRRVIPDGSFPVSWTI